MCVYMYMYIRVCVCVFIYITVDACFPDDPHSRAHVRWAQVTKYV